jgi:tetratricopeptide (TPR) repeat protein
MSERDADHPTENGEPTIVPVRRRTVSGAEREHVDRRPRSPQVLTILSLLIALAGVVGVFFYLPAWMEREQRTAAPVPARVESPAVPAEPVLSAEEIAALRDQAEALLAELLEQQQSLTDRSAASWGAETWTSYQQVARQADDAFLAEDLGEAVSQYQSALELGRTLLARSASIVGDALAAGAAAIASGNATIAASQYSLVLQIDPSNQAAAAGLRRAEALPDVLAAMQSGDAHEAIGELESAAEAYRRALAIDGNWEAARAALDAVNRRIADSRFDRLLADGFAAIAAHENDRAVESFGNALKARPDSDAARDGLAQAEQAQLLDAIAMAEVRGKAFERTERWDQAIERYREALAVDPSLAFAKEGLDRAQRRADLAQKLKALIDEPRRLLNADVLADGQRLLAEARAVEEPGPQHQAQTTQLATLIELASTPINVRLVSDGATEVIVYRVGELGAFTEKDLELKPGSYTAVGQRRGYRDVRQNFTVLPGAAIGPVTVICQEPI